MTHSHLCLSRNSGTDFLLRFVLMLLFSHRLFSYECGAVIVAILFCFVFIYSYSLCDKRKSSKIASKLPSMYSYNFFKALSNFIIDISMIEWQISTTTTITTTTKEKKWNEIWQLDWILPSLHMCFLSLIHSFIDTFFNSVVGHQSSRYLFDTYSMYEFEFTVAQRHVRVITVLMRIFFALLSMRFLSIFVFRWQFYKS